MKYVKEYQEVLQKLYDAAMKYPDEKLAKAVGDVRDLVVEYKNIIDGYETNKKTHLMKGESIMHNAKELWEDFGDIPMNPKTECIETGWNGFPPGTHREEIWHWFEETFHVSVAKDLM